MPRLSVCVLLAVIILSSGSSASAAGRITVFAAASLINALQDIDSAYEKRSDVQIKESFASSSTLARQIEAGTAAQIFISADTKWMDYLSDKGLIATQAPLLGNELALVAPADSKLGPRAIGRGVNWLRLLGADGKLAVGDPDHVPAGIYAKEALGSLRAWSALEPRLARAEDVRGALALVERGDAPLGIVYVTDARESTKVKIVRVFPAETHSPIVYPAAIVKGAERGPADAYFNYLRGTAARAVFVRYGFSPR